jgi:hypothetical protein
MNKTINMKISTSFISLALILIMHNPLVAMQMPSEYDEIYGSLVPLMDTELPEQVKQSPLLTPSYQDEYEGSFLTTPTPSPAHFILSNEHLESKILDLEFKNTTQLADHILKTYAQTHLYQEHRESKHKCPYCGALCIDFTHFAAHCHKHAPQLSACYKCLELSSQELVDTLFKIDK